MSRISPSADSRKEGIAYHFVHDEKSHQLVLTNDNTAFGYLPERKTLDWRPVGMTEDEHFHSCLGEGQEVCTDIHPGPLLRAADQDLQERPPL